MSIVHKRVVRFGSALVSFLKDSCRPQGPGIKPANDHSISTVDAWMDEESGNIIHRPRAFTGTEKYSWFVDGSSRPSPFRRLRREWRNTPPWAGNIGVLSVDLCGSICSGKSIRVKKTLYLTKSREKPRKKGVNRLQSSGNVKGKLRKHLPRPTPNNQRFN